MSLLTACTRRVAAGALASALAVLGPGVLVGAAGAATPRDDSTAGPSGASIAHVESSGRTLQVLVSVPAGAQVDLSRIGVTVDGTRATARAASAAGDTTVRRTAVLAIDTSRSMHGERFDAARAAAREFVSGVPSDVYVGIVTFAGDVQTALAPTQDHQAALGVLDGLRLTRETHLYDGITQAVDVAGSEGQRSLLVLSDGADTTDTPITEATSAVKDAGVLADVVALDQSGPDLDALRSIAEAGHGQVIASDAQTLQATFAAEAAVLAHQVLVTATVPDSVTARQATVEVTLPTGDGDLTAQAFSTVRPDDTPAPDPLVEPSSGWTPPPWLAWAGPLVLAVGLVLLAVLLVPRSAKLSPADRIDRYTRRVAGPGSETAEGRAALLDTDVTFASTKATAARFLQRNQDLDARISARLEGAGSDLRSSEWLIVHAGVFVVSGLVGILVSGGNLVLGLVFMALGLAGPWAWLGLRKARRRRAFSAALPDTLQLVSGSLAAGLSLAQAIDTIVREGQEPVASEFRRVLVETRLGVGLDDALDGVAERFGSKDFEWVVMAIRIQRQVGGNLAELLDTVGATMREREYVRRQVAALAAEGKLSAYVLGALPPLFMLYLLLTNYTYVSIMFHRPLGWAMLVGGALILSVGAFWMSRLVKVEV